MSTAAETVLFTLVVPGTVTVLIPWLLLRTGVDFFRIGFFGSTVLGAFLMAMGVAIYLWCAVEFVRTGRGTPAPIEPPKKLVREGPYRFARNPMYVALVLVLSGEALILDALLLLAYALAVFVGCQLWILFYEEPTLRRIFGDDFIRYRSEVPRWGMPPVRVRR